MEDTFKKILNSLPQAISPLPDIHDNLRLPIYQGSFYLETKTDRIKAEGDIYYSFEGNDRIIIEGILNDSGIDINKWMVGPIRIKSHELSGKFILTRLSNPYSDRPSFSGQVEQIKKGKKLDLHNKWKWAYCNMPYIHGTAIRIGSSMERGRLSFTNHQYRIMIDNRGDLNKVSQVCDKRKFVSHYCELERIDGAIIDMDEAFRVIDVFSQFIGFMVGRRQAPYFIQGFNQQDCLETEYHQLREDDSLAKVDSWNPFPYEEDIISYWPVFFDKYSSKPDQKDILNTAVHWYLEANANHGMLEGAFIMAFAGLELMYNVLIGASKANNEDIVKSIAELVKMRDKVSPSGIANMRNQLVHYGHENRSKYVLLSRDEKLLRMSMLLELLELVILYWLGYKGHYHDRLCGPCYKGDNVFIVPWCEQCSV